MPLMSVPRYEPLTADELARRLVQEVIPILRGSMAVCAHATAIDGAEPARRTRVPFLKCCTAGSFHIDDPDGRRHPVHAGDTCLFTAGSAVNDRFFGPCRFLRLTADVDLTLIGFETITGGRPGREARESERAFAAHTCHHPLGACARHLLERLVVAPADPDHARSLVTSLLYELAELVRRPDPDRSPAQRRYREARHFIAENGHLPIDRSDAARALGISPAHLSRLFQQHGDGRSFQQVLLEHRLAHARRFLAAGEQPIAAIAERCGFASANYFAQAFRRVEGVAPSVWRSQSD